MPQLGEGLHLIPLNWKVHQHIIPILRELVIQHNNSQHMDLILTKNCYGPLLDFENYSLHLLHT